MLEHLGRTELLRRWSGEAVAHADDVGLEVTPAMRASGWIGTPPASAADTAAAQARLERSYLAFLAITDGWPVLSMDFGQVRPVAGLDWAAAADPGFYEVVCADDGYEWPRDSDDGPPLMNRALLLSSGRSTDIFLYDTGRPGADGEWATTCWTSWYPGAGGQQPDDQLRPGNAQVIMVPPGAGEEGMRPVMRPGPRQARPGQHPADRALPGLGDETAGQGRARAKRRRGEQRGEHGQQRHQRRRDRHGCVREHQRELVHDRRRARPAPSRAGHHGQRAAITGPADPQRRHRPDHRPCHGRLARLGEPLVRYRGQYCYVAALLPGHREPMPVLRLRWQGSPDDWIIGIYKASTGQCNENEFPGALGGATGTPEQGIDETFILYAGPDRELTER